MRINSVTTVRKKFSEVHGVFLGTVQLITSVFNYVYVARYGTANGKWQLMRRSSEETRLQAVNSQKIS